MKRERELLELRAYQLAVEWSKLTSEQRELLRNETPSLYFAVSLVVRTQEVLAEG
jgi:hypothetical protein